MELERLFPEESLTKAMAIIACLGFALTYSIDSRDLLLGYGILISEAAHVSLEELYN